MYIDQRHHQQSASLIAYLAEMQFALILNSRLLPLLLQQCQLNEYLQLGVLLANLQVIASSSAALLAFGVSY